MKNVAYLRVSTSQQGEQKTIEIQRDRINGYAVSKQIIIDEYFEDEGVSGVKEFFDRPQGRELWKQIEAGQVERLIVTKIDRVARSITAFVNLANHAKEYGCGLVVLDENYDFNTAQGKMMLNFLAIFAEFEHDRIQTRLIEGKRKMARDGKVLSPAPFGYLKKDYQLYVDEELREYVKYIFEAYLFGISLRDLADDLNNKCIPAPPRAKNGWKYHHIFNLIKNPAYYGEYKAFRTTIKKTKPEPIYIEIPAIISRDLFDQVQQKVKDKIFAGRKSSKRFYLLRGLVRCGLCGYAYTGRLHAKQKKPNGKGYYKERVYYECSSKNKPYADKSIKCVNKTIKAEDLEPPVWNAVLDLLSNPSKVMEDILKLQRKNSTKQNKNLMEIKKLENKIKDNQKKRRNIVDLVSDGTIQKNEARQNLDEITSKIEKLESRVANINNLNIEVDLKPKLKTVEDVIRHVQEMLNGKLNDQMKENIVNALISKVIINPPVDGKPEVEVEFIFDNSIFNSNVSKVV